MVPWGEHKALGRLAICAQILVVSERSGCLERMQTTVKTRLMDARGVSGDWGVGEHVRGSPFLCQVEAGAVDPASSRVFGPGLSAVQLGRDSQIFIELSDQFGNRVISGTANFKV